MITCNDVKRKVSLSVFEIYNDKVHDLLLLNKEEEALYADSIKSTEVSNLEDAIKLIENSFSKKRVTK